MELADTLPVAFARLARLVGGVRPRGGVAAYGDGGAPVTWGELAVRARLLALALDERGVGRGDTVAVTIPDGPLRIAAYQAVLAVGGIITDDDSAGWRFDPGGLAGNGDEVTSHLALLAAGRAVDQVAADRFEQLAATVAPDDVAVRLGDECFTHDELLWGLRSVGSWLAPVVADADVGSRLDVVVPRGWQDPGRVVFGVWWPLTVGATVHVAGPPTGTTDSPATGAAVVTTMTRARPVVAIAEPAVWAALAGVVRSHPDLDRSGAGRRYLRAGRARAAGERLGPADRLSRRVLDSSRGGRLRRDLGLDRCRWAVSLGRPDEAVRRDLAAVGVDLVVTNLVEGVVGPVTATAPGSPVWSSGSPLPGRTVTVEAGEVVVGGAGVCAGEAGGGARRTGRHGRLTADGQLRLERP
jgi:hypothetical protein